MPVARQNDQLDTALPGTDHRVRVARERRERMRAHLLVAVLEVHSNRPPGARAVIDDVVKHADVSRGTFYKYFSSLEEAVEQLGAQLADELAEDFAALFGDIDTPLMRVATGFALFLLRASMEPRWGAFVAHLYQGNPGRGLLREMMRDLNAGVRAGVFEVSSVDVALDLMVGAKVQAIRHLLNEPSARPYIEAMTGMMLRSLGIQAAAADRAAADALQRLHADARGRLAWWRMLR